MLINSVAVTAMIVNYDDEILLTQRSDTKKRWPGYWTFPGGNVEGSDFLDQPTEINNQWYDVLEKALKREVKEEVGLDIINIDYLCNIFIPNGIIISFTAQPNSKVTIIDESEIQDYKWVPWQEALDYKLIEGLDKEILRYFDPLYRFVQEAEGKVLPKYNPLHTTG